MAHRVVLVDMDNTLVSFEDEFQKRWKAKGFSEKGYEILVGRKKFELEQNFEDPADVSAAESIMGEAGFYIAFEPLPGAVEAMKDMVSEGIDVRLCTAPHPLQYESCSAEKFAWVKKHMGAEWCGRLMITRDKSFIKGDVLVDDKPAVTGAVGKPDWQQVVFTASYNVDVELAGRSRLDKWADWRDVILPLLPKA